MPAAKKAPLPKRAAILTGGTSLERDIAFRSAATFAKFSPLPCDTYDFPAQVGEFLARRHEYGFVFPVFHGEWGEDGLVSAFLEALGIPYAFSPFATHALCLDKAWANEVARGAGVAVPAQRRIRDLDGAKGFDLPFPVIVKPNRGGSSFATHKARNRKQFLAALQDVFDRTGDDALVQEFVEGEEYSVPVYGTPEKCEVLPIMHVRLIKSDFFDYEEKYLSDGSNEVFGDVSPALAQKLAADAVRVWRAVGCRGVARVDFRVRKGKPYFLEVNTIPGFTEASIFPKAWKLTGRTLRQLVAGLVKVGRDAAR